MTDQPDLEEIQKQLDDANALAARYKQEAAKNKRLADKTKDIDLDDYKALQEKKDLLTSLSEEELAQFNAFRQNAKDANERRLLEQGGMDAVVDHRTQSIREHYDGRVAALEAERDVALGEAKRQTQAYQHTMFEIAVRDAVSASGRFRDGVEKYVATEVMPFIQWEDGKMRLVRDGQSIFSPEDVSRDMTIDEFVKHEVPKIAPSLTNQIQGVGAKGSGDATGDNPFMDKRRATEQRSIRNQNPDLAKRLAKAARDAGKGDQIKAANV